eukprot:10900105-Ditylum_brightwellii.AAC.1
MADKVKDWVKSVKCFLSMVRRNQQAVHTVFSHPLQHKWSFLQRVAYINPAAYEQLDRIIQEELILAILDVNVFNNTLLPLFPLPI